MKKVLFIFGVLVLMSNCKSDVNGVNLTFRENFSFAAGLSTVDTHASYLNIDADMDPFLNDKGVEKSAVTAVTPLSARLIVIQGFSELAFVDRVKVYISPKDSGGNSPDRELAFFLDNVPFNTGTILELQPTLLDFRELSLLEEYQIDLALDLRQFSPANLVIQLDYTMVAIHD